MKVERRIWIELPTPANNDEAWANCVEANRMMDKLGSPEDVFAWDEDQQQYLRLLPGGAGFMRLQDNGDWFNLSRLSSSISI